MDDYKHRIQIAKNTIGNYDRQEKDYCITVTAEYEDSTKNFKIISAEKGLERFDEAISEAINHLKAEKIHFVIYKGKKENPSNIDNDVTIEISENSPAEKSRFQQGNQQLDLLEKVTALLEKNEQLGSIAAAEKSKVTELKHEKERDLLEIKHEIQIDRLNQQIKKLTEDNTDLSSDLTEATKEIEKFQDIYGTEQKLEKGARNFTAILKGAVAMAPGLIGYAQKFAPGLGGLAQALINDGGSPTEIVSPTTTTADTNNLSGPQFEQMQRVLTFTQGLSPEETILFMELIDLIDKDRSILYQLNKILKS